MGCWRQIIIDDKLPVDVTNHVLLPSLEKSESSSTAVAQEPMSSKSAVTTGSAKSSKAKLKPDKGKSCEKLQNNIEMWPFLLCKALLKIANLTQNQCDEILDFDIIHCLTGWFVQKINVTGTSVVEIWEMCAAYSDHYTWPNPSKKQDGSKEELKSSKSSKESKGSKSSKSVKSVKNFLDEEGSRTIPYHLVATCSDMRTLAVNKVPDISPCWSHCFLIDQTRDIPLVKPDPLPEISRWKRFRWLAWAIRNGSWPIPELIPIKCFKIVSLFKGHTEHSAYKPLSKEAVDIKKSVAVIEDLAVKMGDGKSKDGKDKESRDQNKSTKSSDHVQNKKNKKDQVVSLTTSLDPSIWTDFNKLGPYIICLYIFFKPSQFKTSIKVTDIAQNAGDANLKVDKGKKGKGGLDQEVQESQLLIWNNKLFSTRNEPVYLFTESIDHKLILINLAQVGNAKALEQTNAEPELGCDGSESKIKITNNDTNLNNNEKESYEASEGSVSDISESTRQLECTCLRIPFAYIVIEKYDWQTTETGDILTYLNTYGTKTMLTDVKPGRIVFRMWIKCETSYVINLLSDSPVFVGTLEAVLENMCQESEMLMQLCHSISSSYGQLVQKFGTSQFVEGLVSFCRSYLPDYKLSKQQRHILHNYFLTEFLHVIKELYSLEDSKQILRALKVLFMNPTLKFEILDNHELLLRQTESENVGNAVVSVKSSQTSENIRLLKKREKAAVKLQSYFKTLYILKLRSLHQESHKDYLKIFNTLKKLYVDCFGVQKRMSICSTLIRNLLLLNPNMSCLKQHYSLLTDLNSTIHLQHFTGNMFVTSNTWVPIARYAFYCNSPKFVTTKICLFSNFPKFIVRVFDNDTYQEIKRFTNNTTVFAYKSNLRGYTVLCYGWSQAEDNFQWKLDFITVRTKFVSLIIVPSVAIYNFMLQQTYRPNVRSRICRCTVNINRDILVTLRLSTSYENVKLYLRCVNEVGQVFGETYGTSSVILPIILLKFVPIVEQVSDTVSVSQQSGSSKERKFSRSKSRSSSLVRGSTNTSLKPKMKSFDKESLDRHSSKSSTTRRSRSSNVSRSIINYRDTIYIIEGYAVDNSWPLTKDEWNIVEDIKTKSLLGPILTDHATTSSLSSEGKFSSKRSSQGSKKSYGGKRKSSEVKISQEPFWYLQAITDKEDSLTVYVDRRRQEEINSIKRQWYENDAGRYDKSKQLRREYLESHYIKCDEPSDLSRTEGSLCQNSGNSGNKLSVELGSKDVFDALNIHQETSVPKENSESESKNDSSNQVTTSIASEEGHIRTLHRPLSLTKILPPLNLDAYFIELSPTSVIEKTHIKDEEKRNENNEEFLEEEKHVITSEEEEKLILLRAQKIVDFESKQFQSQEDTINCLIVQMKRYKLLDKFYKDSIYRRHRSPSKPKSVL